MNPEPQVLVHIEKSVDLTIFDVKWIPESARLVAMGSTARGNGVLEVYSMAKGQLNLIHKIEKPKSIKTGTFAASHLPQRHLATGDFDGTLAVWDVERLDRAVFQAAGHQSIINAIDGLGGLGVGVGAAELATAGRDGLVQVWDVRQQGPVAVIEAEEGQNRRDCWAVAFGGGHCAAERIVAAGYENGDFKMFDLRTMRVHWETNVGNGICGIEFDRKDVVMNKVSVSTLDSRVFVFDLRTRHPVKGYAFARQKAHKSTVWTVRHSPHDRDLSITCGGNGTLCLWKYEYPAKRSAVDSEGRAEGVPGKLRLVHEAAVSPQPITAFDWNASQRGLGVCCSFDQTLRVVAVPRSQCIS